MFNKMNVFRVLFEIEIDGKTQRQTIKAPQFMIEQQFLSYVEQAANATLNPVKIKMIRSVPVWNQLDNKIVNQENSITFTNFAYKNL